MLLWDVLKKKRISVERLEFALVNLPIIALAMTICCTVLICEVYIFRSNNPYNL